MKNRMFTCLQRRPTLRSALLVGSLVVSALLSGWAGQAQASFHLAHIDEVLVSYDGDASSQFVEIQMLAAGQGIVSNTKLSIFGANGDFSSVAFTVPSNVGGAALGRWIMGTAQFQTDSGLTPDFVFAGGLPTDGGMLCWGKPNDETNPEDYVDCLAYGTYSGPSNSHIGTATTLTPVGHSLVRIGDSGSNAADFACGDPATPENVSMQTVDLPATSACPVLFSSEWDAQSGLFPDETAPPWSAIDSAEPEDADLGGGVLTISTSQTGENIAYSQSEPLIVLDPPFTLEFRMRYVSGMSTGASRAPGFIGVTTDPQTGIGLFVGQDEVFITTVGDVREDTAVVDTDDMMHDYRMDIAEDGSLTVRQDGTVILTGATWTSNNNFGPLDRIIFGEASILTFGVIEFEFFRHNAQIVTTTTSTTSTTSTTMVADVCGDANIDGSITATDALHILQSAVGQPLACPLERCDVDDSAAVVASDALRVLQFAVGLGVTLECPAA